MATQHQLKRKSVDAEILRLNSVGMSLQSIAEIMDCHPSTITLRLKSLKVPPADTRRTFMEDVFTSLSKRQQQWLMNQLGPHISIKDYVRNLLIKEYLSTKESPDVQ